MAMVLLLVLSGCRHDYVPKPRGYFRIDLPDHKYKTWKSECPYRFEYPVYCEVLADRERFAEPCWINIEYRQYHGTIHISYKSIYNNLESLLEDTRSLVYKHTVKADAIAEHLYTNPDHRVYGILYDITGNAASSVQFFLTDSTRHFLRGALYFATVPNADSLMPVTRFVREDIVHMMETLEWMDKRSR
jgi:gliding motility-associated lipoprotein GldD